MNEQLTTRLLTLMDYLGQTAKDVDGLVREQAPLVAREIVNWYLTSSLLGVGLGLLLLISVVLVAKLSRKMYLARTSHLDDGWIAVMIASIFLGVAGLVVTSFNVYTATRALAAPRLVVLDYVKGFK